MKKLDIAFEGGVGDVFYSIKSGRIFTAEFNHEELTSIYGGKMYYFSKTGLSGKGWIGFNNDLVKINSSFPINWSPKNYFMFKEENGIYAFVNTGSHTPFDGVVILSDGEKIIACSPGEIPTALRLWNTLEFENRTITGFSSDGDEFSVDYKLLIMEHTTPNRVDFRRFVKEVAQFCGAPLTSATNILSSRVHLCQVGENFYHLNRVGFFDKKWDFNPMMVPGTIIGNWEVAFPGVCFCRYDDSVAWIATADRGAFHNGKYFFQDDSGLIDFECNESVWSFFEKGPDYFEKILLKKAREDFVFSSKHLSKDFIRSLLIKNAKENFSIQDSLDAGNCLPASIEFIKKFQVKCEESLCLFHLFHNENFSINAFKVSEILENQHLEEMLEIFGFRKLIANKFIQ